MSRRAGTALVSVAALGIVAAVGYAVLHGTDALFPASDECTASVDGHKVDLTVEQAENAAIITAISVRRGMPARAASIALAAAYQESDLTNLEVGDRDSLGLFQQRPSQGWGTREQILDPVYATNAFYNALDRVDGYESLEITVAAQEVQRSGFPDAYADHEADARALASALTGNSPHAFACDIDDAGAGRGDRIRREVRGVFDVQTGLDGQQVDVTAGSTGRGWAIAHYLVAMADRLDIGTVTFGDRIWRAGDGDKWHASDSSSGNGVHVEVRA
jgi:hypothetical protein